MRTSYNGAEGGRESDGCVEIVKVGGSGCEHRKDTKRQEVMFLSLSFTAIVLLTTHPAGLKEKRPKRNRHKKTQR